MINNFMRALGNLGRSIPLRRAGALSLLLISTSTTPLYSQAVVSACPENSTSADAFFEDQLFIGKVLSWMEYLSRQSDTPFQYFVGNPRQDQFAGFPARRMLIIAPSEYFRDSTADWDSFELLIGYSEVPSDGLCPIWISTENYRRRAKGILSRLLQRYDPSPDWEYNSVSETDVTNTSLLDIANTLKDAAEQGQETAVTILPAADDD